MIKIASGNNIWEKLAYEKLIEDDASLPICLRIDEIFYFAQSPTRKINCQCVVLKLKNIYRLSVTPHFL
jgi:hypothetical protein